MFWFGLGRAFGVKTSGIIQSGPYRYSRNPQILGGYLLVIGISMQWPSLYSFGWVILYGVVSHMMILTEEEYLSKQYGEAYTQYCKEVPRYLLLRKREVNIFNVDAGMSKVSAFFENRTAPFGSETNTAS